MPLIQTLTPRLFGGFALFSGTAGGGGGGGSEFGEDEPQFEVGDVLLYEEDWSSYSSASDLTSGAGDFTYTQRGIANMSIETGAPLPPGGTKKVRFNYTSQGQDILLDCELDPPNSSTSAAVVWQFYFRQLGTSPSTVHVGKMGEVLQDASQRMLMHTSSSPPYPNGEASGGNLSEAAGAIAGCYWSNLDPFTADNSTTTEDGYNVAPTWNCDDVTLPGGLGYAYKPFLGKDVLGEYTSFMDDAAWHRFTVRFIKGPSAGRDRLQMWLDGTLVTDYDGDDTGACQEGKVHMVRHTGAEVIANLHIGGPANETGNGVAANEWGPMSVFVDNT